MTTFQEWAVEQHSKTNHLYANNLPYEFHLEMVAKEVENFSHIIPFISNNIEAPGTEVRSLKLRDIFLNAAWGHDLIEDARVTYNDILKAGARKETVDIIYALTNEKGKNRSERANDKYYEGIRNTPGAALVKLCDRIANVKFGLLTGSRIVDKYLRENDHFKHELLTKELEPLFERLDKLFHTIL